MKSIFYIAHFLTRERIKFLWLDSNPGLQSGLHLLEPPDLTFELKPNISFLGLSIFLKSQKIQVFGFSHFSAFLKKMVEREKIYSVKMSLKARKKNRNICFWNSENGNSSSGSSGGNSKNNSGSSSNTLPRFNPIFQRRMALVFSVHCDSSVWGR